MLAFKRFGILFGLVVLLAGVPGVAPVEKVFAQTSPGCGLTLRNPTRYNGTTRVLASISCPQRMPKIAVKSTLVAPNGQTQSVTSYCYDATYCSALAVLNFVSSRTWYGYGEAVVTTPWGYDWTYGPLRSQATW